MTNFISELTGTFSSVEKGFQSSPAGVLFLVVGLLVALAWCFFGYKSQKVVISIIAFIVGLFIGRTVVDKMALSGTLVWAVPLIAGAVLFLLGFFLYRFGVFLAVLVMGTFVVWHLAAEYMALDESISFLIGAAAGLILAILCMVLMRPLIILVSSLTGGFGFAGLLCRNFLMIRWDSKTAMLTETGIGLVLALIAIIYQFRSTRRERRR